MAVSSSSAEMLTTWRGSGYKVAIWKLIKNSFQDTPTGFLKIDVLVTR